MKPLPFDMTPLTRSLHLAPATRRSAAAAEHDEAPRMTKPVPGADAPKGARPADSRTEKRDTPPARNPIEVEERTIELPYTPRRAETAPSAESTEAASAPESDPSPSRVADPASKAPATELRTATYPLHFKRHRGWSGRLAQEQTHALATHVLARHTERNLRTLAVTSALAGEGKTTVTLALAEKLAKAGKRILILDLDAHRATLSHECGLDDAAGALQSSDPRDPTNMDFHVYSSNVPGIWIMPAGFPEPGADGPPILSPVHVGVLVLRALDDFDLVLLDCPPLLPVADTHVIGEVVDTALLVVRAGVTPREMIDQAIDEFGRDKFLGAVLNRAQPKDIPYFREVYGYYRRDSARG